jgi:hypothetical protein
LAYKIAQRYYRQVHYVWCTPFLDPSRVARGEEAVPPTSSPLELFRSLRVEVEARDRHSHRIEENRSGILRGSNAKRQAGIIDEREERDIASIVSLAQHGDFRPLLFVIPYAGVESLLSEPSPADKAHPLSAEYIIDALPRDRFDVIEF